MADEKTTTSAEGVQKTRRAIVTSAAQVAVTAPAVGLLLSASSMPAAAQSRPYGESQDPSVDDFHTTGSEDDGDGLATGTAELDDNGIIG
jgi:hypothetical protein